MPSVTSASRSASGPFSRRSISRRGCGTSEKCGSPGLGSGLGEPWKKAARMPLSFRPSMPASVCSGVGLLCAQSTSVVTPWSSWFSAPARVAMWMSSGVNTVARPACTWRKYSSSVQLAATERSAVCQVCMWALIRPGSTKCPAQSTISASAASLGAIGGDAAVLDQHVAGRQHAELRILRDDDAGRRGVVMAADATPSCSAQGQL